MDTSPYLPNRVRQHRTARGWTQAELARRAGISRAAVSAVEIERLVPSVAAALALATALGSTVEELFGPGADRPGDPEWAWPPERTPCRYWQAEVRGRVLRFPAEATPAGVVPHDGVFANGTAVPGDSPDPRSTLVVACCDPAAGLLAAEYARASGFRLLALPRPSGAALTLLGQGLVHAAGVHFATGREPDANQTAVRDALGPGHRLLRVARWEEGLAVTRAAGVSSVVGAVRGGLRWVGREPGSAARRCLDELLAGRPTPRRTAHDHRGVAEAVRSGWADVGVCHRLVAEEAGLRFLRVRVEAFDLCYPASAESDPRIAALLRVIRSAGFRRLLGELPGYDAAPAGGVETVR
jgi:molybdate-binding protein/transcriptional regulator with XRE-family HTH domain